MMPIAILAGGLGTRLRPIVRAIPKALVPVRGRPFIDHQLALLRSQGVERAVLCVGYLGEMIEKHVGDGASFGMAVTYSYDGVERLGTAGALKNAIPQLGDKFLAIYGDSYPLVDYRAVSEAFESGGKSALMTVYRNDNALGASNTLFRKGRIEAYDKANPSSQMHHIDFGLSVFRQQAFEGTPLTTATDLSVVFRALLERGDLAGYEVSSRFYEVGSPEGLAETENILATLDLECIKGP
ncbi:MAG: sugar phosphate nucleotidyltransferase [Acidiferrobacteraceae bacterium]